MKHCPLLIPALLLALCCGAQTFDGTDLAGIESIVRDVESSSERWRQEAEERIREHRMADLNLTVLQGGEPVSNAVVRVKLLRHAFRFGGIVNPKVMVNGLGALSGKEYRELFLNFGFNTTGFNNGLKYKLRRSYEALIPEQLEWFADHQIPVRGHCLIWPGRDHMDKEMFQLVALCKKSPSSRNKEKLQRMCEEQIKLWAPKWNVFEWDVINETRGNHDVADLIGEEVYAEWFKLARKYSVDPAAGLYLNENRVVSDPEPGVRTAKMTLYIDTVEKLLNRGAPVTGLGLQSRFHSMIPAETIYERLCLLGKLNLPIAATEFEIGKTVEGELNKAIMTERVMTIYFSYPLANGIYAWTLLPSGSEGETGRNILEGNGHPNLRGKVWLYLMKNRWMTDEKLAADENGNVSVRGFLGDYEITVEHNGRTQTVPLTLDKALRQTIRL
ncbi:MAG: endo-1,4-beta-xylanase [Verrucomicrobia bacterium]|nr:endo-1,4-beta-xylanase [Verrucomicrobiota bacterium]